MKRPVILIPGEGDRFINYGAAVAAGGGIPVFCPAGEAPRCDGLLLCGGGDIEPWRYGQENTDSYGLEPERDARELVLLDRFAAERKPVLGICRGMQLINVYFGGTLTQHRSGHSRSDGADRLHRTRISGGFLQILYGEETIVNSAHHQCLDRVGGELQVTQWAPDAVVEGICHRRLPIWGVQWHPERMRRYFAACTADGNRLFRAFLEQCR